MSSRYANRRPVNRQLTHQVFVANPKKPPQIEAILRRNKEKLLVFLKNFHNDKEGTLYRLFAIDMY